MVTLAAPPHEMGATELRMSYFAGWPVPSVTCVNVSVTELLLVALAARLFTVPGLVVVPDVTVIADVADLPEHAAVIVAEPAATPRARPAELTVATDALLLVQVYGEQLIVAPLAFFAVALSCCVAPT